MGSKNKLKRFRENDTFSNVVQPTREEVFFGFKLKGKWNSVFKNDNPIILELGCGKGEYSLALAEKNPDKNSISVRSREASIRVVNATQLLEGIKKYIYNPTFLEAKRKEYGPKLNKYTGYSSKIFIDELENILISRGKNT